jgi:hypothetical protein
MSLRKESTGILDHGPLGGFSEAMITLKDASQNAQAHFSAICQCGCGKSYTPTRKWQKYASYECRKRAGKNRLLTEAKAQEIEMRLFQIIKEIDSIRHELKSEREKKFI